jgi:hypothetical protein
VLKDVKIEDSITQLPANALEEERLVGNLLFRIHANDFIVLAQNHLSKWIQFTIIVLNFKMYNTSKC